MPQKHQYFTDAERLRILDASWQPTGLTLDDVKSQIGNGPRLLLSVTIELMVAAPAHGEPPESIITRRQQAARALFEAARSEPKSVFIGSRDLENDQPIEARYFDVPRTLGHEDNSIETDFAKCVDDPKCQHQFDGQIGKSQPWRNVRVNADFFLAWIGKKLGITAPANERNIFSGQKPRQSLRHDVQKLIKSLYGRIPEHSEVPDAALVRKVQNNAKSLKRTPSRHTILRAAGRY
jgi:hypothetical protein